MEKPMGQSSRAFKASTEDGVIFDFTGQGKVENAIWGRIQKKIFHLAEQAPIYQGKIRGDFGYLANTPATIQVLYRTYNYPP